MTPTLPPEPDHGNAALLALAEQAAEIAIANDPPSYTALRLCMLHMPPESVPHVAPLLAEHLRGET